MKNHTLRFSSLLLAAVLLVLPLTSCGNSGQQTPPPSTGGGTTVNTPAANTAHTPEETKQIIADLQKNANWDEMALDSGILDTITQIKAVDKEYTIRIGTPTGGKNEQNYVMALFEAYMEASTAGKVQVELYPSSQLGTAQQMIQGLLDGSVQGVAIPLDYFYTYAPASGVTSIPFLFTKGSAQAARIFTEDSTMDDYLKTKGFWPIAWLYEHSFTFIADRAINDISDFKGMKIWVLPSTLGQMEVEAYGATPSLMDPSDVALSLQNGTIDAGYSGVTFFNNMKLQDSCQYLNKVPMKSIPCVLMFGAAFMQGLPEDLQQYIEDAGRMIIADYEKAYVEKSIDISVASILETCEEVLPSDQLIADMKNATQDIHDFYKNTDADCGAMYNKMMELIVADEAAGGESLPY